ncbi:MAG: NAD-dependent epimerase/dehydratase family protein [Pyrinomonadaceae bacterium]|nr:NAD-dependent epimerase/dehydratase family protein [Pyrinomonadaceae bacterium]
MTRDLPQKTCFVTGATGVVGVPLVEALVEQNYKVRVLLRDEKSKSLFPAGVEILQGDLFDENALNIGTAGANFVFHLAAKLHINNPNSNLAYEYKKTNVDGTKRVIDVSRKNGIEKFIFFSTINVYGASVDGQIFDENSVINPNGFYAESKAEAENLVLNENFGVVLRLAAVYGSRMKGNYVKLLQLLRKGRFIFIGDGSNRRTLIHQSDVAKASILAAQSPDSCGQIFNVTNGKIHSLQEIIGAMSFNLNRPAPKLKLPLAPVRFGVGVAENIGGILKLNLPINCALLEKFVEDVAVSGLKIRQKLNFQPTFDLVEGWRETIDNFRDKSF